MSWKSVSFSEMGSNWPSQNIQPAGAKLPANILISPTYGCANSFSLVLARENPLQGNTEAQCQERLHIEVRLAAADISYATGAYRYEISRSGIQVPSCCKDVVAGKSHISIRCRSICHVRM